LNLLIAAEDLISLSQGWKWEKKECRWWRHFYLRSFQFHSPLSSLMSQCIVIYMYTGPVTHRHGF